MTWVAVAVAGGAIIGAGTQAGMGALGASSASNAGAIGAAGQVGSQAFLRDQLNQINAIYNPFVNAGMGANAQLQSLLYSPQQLDNVLAQQESQLMAQKPVQQIVQQGRRMEVAQQAADADYKNKMAAWNQRYQEFKKQSDLMRQQAQANAGPNGVLQQIQQSPIYQYQAKLTNHALASQGLLGSQKAIAEQGMVSANAYGHYIDQLTGLSSRGLQATAGLSNNLIGVGSQIAGNISEAANMRAQGIVGSAANWQQGATGAANSINSATGSMLNYNLFQQMMVGMNRGQSSASQYPSWANLEGITRPRPAVGTSSLGMT